MNSPKNLALIALSVVAIGAGVLAWNQHLELQALRVAAEGSRNRDALQRRAHAAEQRAKDLADQLAAAHEKLQVAKSTAVAKAEAPRRSEEAGVLGGNVRTMIGNAANMMNQPEMQRMMAMSQKAGLDTNYATLFKQLKLAPEKLEQLKKLMVERQTVGTDVLTAAIQQGLDPAQSRGEIRKMAADAQSKVDGEIKALLGEGDYASYRNYQTTLPQRGVVNQLAQSLSYTTTPLSDAQAEQLVQIFAANPPARSAAVAGAAGGGAATQTRTMVFTAGSPVGGGADFVVPAIAGGSLSVVGGPAISDAAVSASRSVLSDPQHEALQQMQQQQAQMRSMMQQPGGFVAPAPGGGGIIRIESSTTTAPAHPPVERGKPPGGE